MLRTRKLIGRWRKVNANRLSSARSHPPSTLPVLVVPPPPDARLVSPLWRPVQPMVHPPESVQSPRICGIRVIDRAVLERERTHAGPLTRIRGRVGSGHRRVVADRIPRHVGHDPLATALLPRRLTPVVVFD